MHTETHQKRRAKELQIINWQRTVRKQTQEIKWNGRAKEERKTFDSQDLPE